MTEQPRSDNLGIANQGHQNSFFAVSYIATKRPYLAHMLWPKVFVQQQTFATCAVKVGIEPLSTDHITAKLAETTGQFL